MAEGDPDLTYEAEEFETETGLRFSVAAVWALLISLAAHAIHLLTGFPAEWLFAVNLGIMILLIGVALWRQRRASTSDMTIASETIVAFGVLSLILGLAVAAFPFLVGAERLSFDAGAIQKLSIPFLQGLAMAGIAPVVAVVLRNYAAESDNRRDPVGDLADVGRAAGRLAREMNAATASVSKLKRALSIAVTETEAGASAVGANLQTLASHVQTGGQQVAVSLDNGSKSIATEVAALSKALNASLNLSAVTASLSECEKRISAFGTSTDASTQQVIALKTEIEQLQAAAATSAQLLNSLTTLIASVERFVEPRTNAPQ